MATGNLYCRFCHGRGGWQSHSGWRTCPCVRGNRLTARVVRETRERLSGQKQLTMDDMLRMGSSKRRDGND